MARLISLVIIVFTLASCAISAGDRIKQLNVGMTRAEVTDILGRPDGVRIRGDYEAMEYANRRMKFWAPNNDRADYYIILENGLVSEFGPGEIRQGPNTLILVPY